MSVSLVRIANPLPGQRDHLGHEHASRYVRRGEAEWLDRICIRFFPDQRRGDQIRVSYHEHEQARMHDLTMMRLESMGLRFHWQARFSGDPVERLKVMQARGRFPMPVKCRG